MQRPEVREITITEPLVAVGKIFTGDYAKAKDYVMELHTLLNQESVSFIPYKVMGVYYDNPQEKKAEDLRSFQGVFLTNKNEEVGAAFTKHSLQGRYLFIRVSGDPMKSIYEGYGVLFSHIQQYGLKLKSTASYQVSTFENGIIHTEIYMQTE